MLVLLQDGARAARLPIVVLMAARYERVLPHRAVPVRFRERSLAGGVVGVVAEGLGVALARRAGRVPAWRRVMIVVCLNSVVDVLARVHRCISHTQTISN